MIIDSSVLFALLVAEDADHAKAVVDVGAAPRPLLLPDRVAEELATALMYKKGVEFALAAMDQISLNTRFELYQVSHDESIAAFELMKRVRSRMSFVDYLVAYLAHQRAEPALTYDKQIRSVINGL